MSGLTKGRVPPLTPQEMEKLEKKLNHKKETIQNIEVISIQDSFQESLPPEFTVTITYKNENTQQSVHISERELFGGLWDDAYKGLYDSHVWERREHYSNRVHGPLYQQEKLGEDSSVDSTKYKSEEAGLANKTAPSLAEAYGKHSMHKQADKPKDDKDDSRTSNCCLVM